MDIESAQDGLISAMKAFDISTDDVKRKILDNINEIGNTMAVSNNDIVEGLKRSASAMSVANNSFEQTIALITAGTEITRDAEGMGAALKTISMRIRGYDEETEELSEDLQNISGDIADLTKTAENSKGISLFTDESKTTYKSTYQLLKDISEIYHDLTDKQQAELLEKLAGKRGGQVLAGILDDFSEVERAMGEMENSFGSADREMGIVEESIDYKLNRLKETWVGTLQAFANRETIGEAIDLLTQLSNGLGFVVEKLGILGTLGVGVGSVVGFKNAGRGKMHPLKINMPAIISVL
jgi:TP901 family phage tail tape measure protein